MERKCLCCSRERNRKEKKGRRSQRDGGLREITRNKEEMRGGRHTEATLAQLQKSENKGAEEDQKREDGIEKENSEED